MADNTNTAAAPEVSTQDYLDAIKEAKASGKSMSVNYGSLPEGVVAAAIHTAMADGLPQEYKDAIGEAASRGKTISLDFSQIKPEESIKDKLLSLARPIGDAFKTQVTDLTSVAGAPSQLAQAATGTVPQPSDMSQRVANFTTGTPNPPSQSLIQSAANRPDISAGILASLIPGAGLTAAAARVAASAVAAATNPENRGTNATIAGGLQTLLEALPYGAGKVAPVIKAIMSKGSGVEAQNIAKLFENPALLFTGPSKAEAQATYAAAANKLGLSSEVSDEVTFGMGKRFLKNVTDALNHGEDVATQALLDARKAADDLIEAALRRGEKGMAKGLTQRRDIIQQQITAQAPTMRAADKTFADAATRGDFMALLPKNANGTPSIGKTVIGSLAGVVPAVAMSPIVQGLATSAAGAIKASGPAIPTGLQAIRQFLLTHRPGK